MSLKPFFHACPWTTGNPENIQTGGMKACFFDKTPGIFMFVIFTLGNFRENKASPLEILQNCVTPLGSSKAKNQDPWKFHIVFSLSLLEIPLLF